VHQDSNQEINIIRSSILCGAIGLVLMLWTSSSSARSDSPAGVTIMSGENRQVLLTAAHLAKLPKVTVSISFGTDHGQFHGTFAGPLLWTTLVDSKTVDPKSPRQHVNEIVLITGADGYTATLALDEISPEFENKSVILAEQMNGKLLGQNHFRLVVPGDQRGGRSVRDVVSILVKDPAPKP